MINLGICLGLFAAVIAAHMAWCRLTRVRAIAVKSFAVIWLFGGLFLAGIFFFLRSGDAHFQWVSAVLYACLLPFYVCFYHSIIINSPTRLMLELCRQHRSCTHKELLAAVEQEDFIQSRLQALVESGVANKVNGAYVLSPRGRMLGQFLNAYQLAVGRPKGG